MKRAFPKVAPLWFAIAAAAVLAICVFYFRIMPERQMSQLLASASDAPLPVHRRIRVSVDGQTWLRPAMLSGGSGPQGIEAAQTLFVRANYSWENPLSVRTFALWRSHLRRKHDHVTSLTGITGKERLYRVRTETDDGALIAASLTLRSDNLAALDGSFEFDNHENVTMSDVGQDVVTSPSLPANSATIEKAKPPQPPEREVTAADELRVFAALDQIGADVDEPLDIQLDPGRRDIVVSGMGMTSTREHEIRQALADVPNTIVRFSSAQAPTANTQPAQPAIVASADTNAQLRRILESKAGGAPQLEAIIDSALDASNALLARAHTLAVLAKDFPPETEAAFDDASRQTLNGLRRRHAAVIEQATPKLEDTLKPLLSTSATTPGQSGETRLPRNASWQAGAVELFERVRLLDQSVTNLLSASYSDDVAHEVMDSLPKDLQQVEALAHRQARAQ